jgi:Protein of unknown function (DUF2384)
MVRLVEKCMTNLKATGRSPKPKSALVKPKKKRGVLLSPLSGAHDIIDFTSGPVRIRAAASQLGVSSAQLLETAGVKTKASSGSALTKLDGVGQIRVREMLEIVSRISKWAGGKEQAFAWYRAEPIPAFGSRTAESLVKDGKAAAVRDYLDHVALGGFA